MSAVNLVYNTSIKEDLGHKLSQVRNRFTDEMGGLMFKKDYIMRMIEQFTNVVAKIMGLKAADKFEEIHLVLNEALYDFTGLSESALERLSYKDLINLVSGFEEINTVKCFILAELLKEKADTFASLGDVDQSNNLYIKSFNINVEVMLSNQSASLEPDYDTIDQTIDKIKQIPLPYETQTLRLRYYEKMMKYDKAEDLLFELLDQGADKKTVLAEGIAFYERIMKLKPEELEKGNLPLDEVLEALEIFKGSPLPN